MQSTQGYVTALPHGEALILGGLLIMALLSCLVVWSAWAAASAAKASRASVIAAGQAHQHMMKVWATGVAERALAEAALMEREMDLFDQKLVENIRDITGLLDAADATHPPQSAVAVTELANNVMGSINAQWQSARLIADAVITTLTSEDLLDADTVAAKALKVSLALQKIQIAQSRIERRLNQLKARIEFFDPSDPRNQTRPLGEDLH